MLGIFDDINNLMGQTLPCCRDQQSSQTQPRTTTQIRPPPPPPIACIQPRKPINSKESITSQRPKLSTPKHSARNHPQTTPKHEKLSRRPQNYQHVRILGKGWYGMVVLAEQKLTNKRYAMKMIQKSKINELNLLQTDRLPHIRSNPFLVNIYETFQYNSNVYIVMQYLSKGDLYFYTKKQGIELPQKTIRDVLAQIIVGMEYLHKEGIVYRALKPQNILITDEGHIKLTDYAFAKLWKEDSVEKGISTFIGAIQYMAPEIIKGHFGNKVDVWALGIFAYELKFRENPIQNEGRMHYSIPEYEQLLKKNFLHQKINGKIGYMSHQFRQLLIRLLDQDPQTRISLEDLHNHPFFEQISWDRVKQRTNIPPLAELIKTNDYIKFRDPTTQQSLRKEVFKRHGSQHGDNFALNLFQVKGQ